MIGVPSSAAFGAPSVMYALIPVVLPTGRRTVRLLTASAAMVAPLAGVMTRSKVVAVSTATSTVKPVQ